MAIKTFPITNLKYQVSDHFKLQEFFDPAKYIGDYRITKEMTDKIDVIQIDMRLIDLLEGLRAHFRQKYSDAVVIINDHGGYRPASPVNINKKVGGAEGSQHRYGRAADFKVKANGQYIDAATLAIETESYMNAHGYKGGIGMYHAGDNYIHVDVRGSFTAWYDSYSSNGTPYATAGQHTQGGRPCLLKHGQKCAGIVLLQRKLNLLGYNCGNPDGKWGRKTTNAFKAWQKSVGVKADGIFGPTSNKYIGTLLPW